MTTPCERLADALAEVATGTAHADVRAQVLAHVTTCAACRATLDGLADVADQVLLAVPEHEPPPGFETAVLDRIAPAEVAALPRQPRRWTRRALAGAAAVVAFGVGAGVVWVATDDDRDLADGYRDTLAIAHGRGFTAAPLEDPAGGEVGHVFVYEGDPSWIFAVVGSDAPPGAYRIIAVTGDGRQAIGTCTVTRAGCGAGGTVDAGIADLDRIELRSSSHAPLTATLHRW